LLAKEKRRENKIIWATPKKNKSEKNISSGPRGKSKNFL